MTFGLRQVLFEGFFQFRVIRGLHHLRQGARQLPFGVKQVLQLFDE